MEKAVLVILAGKKENSPDYIVVSNGGIVQGIIKWTDSLNGKTQTMIMNLINTNYMVFDLYVSYPELLQTMKKKSLDYILVSKKLGSLKVLSLKGIITKKEILDSAMKESSLLI